MAIEDWEFEDVTLYDLDNVIYYSYPSSLWGPTRTPDPDYPYIYLYHPDAFRVYEGRFITRWRMEPGKLIELKIFFRQQEPLVHGGDQNGYVIFLHTPAPNYWVARKYKDGVLTTIGSAALTDLPHGTWNRIMLEFYDFIHPTQGLTTRISLFVEKAGDWKSMGFFDDYDPYFKDAPRNRIGFAPRIHDIFTHDWIDNTEVWEKV